MRKLGTLINDLDAIVTKLQGLRDSLKKIEEEAGEVEKARDDLRGRRRPKKDGDTT
jgi:uncharacterized membrane protein